MTTSCKWAEAYEECEDNACIDNRCQAPPAPSTTSTAKTVVPGPPIECAAVDGVSEAK